jgi:4-amino-4-deoxy-L-arabinose transferase-like glycosyltransferase
MSKIIELAYPLILLTVFSLLLFFNLGSTTVIDYDEGVYAEISREMYVAGEPVIPTLNGEDFFEKPPMLYWVQMLGYKLFGINSLGARSINGLCGLATILILFFSARTPLGSRTAFNSSVILGSSFLFVYLSRVAMTDMLLTMFLTLCLVSSWYGVERAIKNQGGAYLFWIGCLAAGCAMLSKGAVGALFPVTTAVIYLISINRMGLLFRKNWLLPGTFILVMVGFSWYLLLGFLHPEGFGFMKDLFMKHHVGRFSSAMEGHSGPFYYYLIVLSVGFLPWFSYLPVAAIHAPVLSSQDPGSRFVRLFVIFSITVFIFFSIAATKLPNYILPVLPGLALITAALFNRERIKYPIIWLAAGWLSAILIGLLGLVLATAPFIISYLPDLLGENSRKAPILAEPVELGYGVWLAALLFIFSAVMIIRSVHKRHIEQIFQALLLSSFIVSATIFLTIMPVYDRLMNLPLARLATEAADHTQADGRIVLYNVSDRPSVMFASNRRTIYHSDRNLQQLPTLFDQQDISVGITTNYYYSRLLSHSMAVHEIDRQGGFVLFNMTEDSGETVNQ